MKLVTAYIKPHKLTDVTLALHDIAGLSGASISDVRGFGRGRAKGVPGTVVHDSLEYLPHVKIEVACTDEILDQVIATIEAGAHTGLRGDGKIYVSTLDEAVRISTGERGDTAA